MGRKQRALHISRDTILFASGLAGIGYETIGNKAEKPTLLILFAAMVGLPAFLRTDEKHQDPKPPSQGQDNKDD